MKITTYDDEDTIYAFSLEKKANIISEESPRKFTKSSAYTVPKSNSHMMEASKQELRNDDTIIALINTTVFCLSYIQHNIFFENKYNSTYFTNYLRLLVLILSVSSILWFVRRYQIKLILMLTKYRVSAHDTIFSTGLYKPMFFELFLALLILPPYIDWSFTVEMLGFEIKYSLSAVFMFIAMAKLYVILRLFGHYSEYTQEKSEIICSKHAVTANAYFSLKCYLKESPFIGIGTFFLVMSVFSSVLMKLCEEPQRKSVNNGQVNDSTLETLWDNLWVIFYTTTTIGYGNLYPYTHIGRAICILACILGNMYLGMLILSINQKMELDEGQNLSYAWISRNSLSNDVKNNATIAIRKAATLFLLSKKWKSKTISPIKPNGIVNCKGVIVRNDLIQISEKQYKVKLRIYREMKSALDKVKMLNLRSREVGSGEANIIYSFEDAVRIDFPKVVRRIKGIVSRKDIEASDLLARACKPAEHKAEKIKDFCKVFKRKVSHAMRRKTVQLEGLGSNRRSHRKLTN